jgi:hypothetical protein
MRTLIIVLGALLVSASPARADEIRMKNGSILYGKIVREDKESVTIDLGRGRMDVSRRNIVSIVRTAPESAPAEPTPADSPVKPAKRSAPEGTPAEPQSGGAAPRVPVAPTARAKRERPTRGPGPKIVPVDRAPQASATVEPVGPESTPPARKPAPRGGGETASKSTSRTVKTDW